ncbi:MAG: hypothetical protein ACP5NW_05360 [Candidatus Woesearchaeota archaeon]
MSKEVFERMDVNLRSYFIRLDRIWNVKKRLQENMLPMFNWKN